MGRSQRHLHVVSLFVKVCSTWRGHVQCPTASVSCLFLSSPFLLLRRVHFHSPVPLKLSHPVSHSFWIFQNWEERFAFLTVSVSLLRLAALVSLHSRPIFPPSFAAPTGPRAVPTWGCVSAAPFPHCVPVTPSLALKCRTPSSYLSPRGPCVWARVVLCFAGLSLRLVLGVPQAPGPDSACEPCPCASRQGAAGALRGAGCLAWPLHDAPSRCAAGCPGMGDGRAASLQSPRVQPAGADGPRPGARGRGLRPSRPIPPRPLPAAPRPGSSSAPPGPPGWEGVRGTRCPPLPSRPVSPWPSAPPRDRNLPFFRGGVGLVRSAGRGWLLSQLRWGPGALHLCFVLVPLLLPPCTTFVI